MEVQHTLNLSLVHMFLFDAKIGAGHFYFIIGFIFTWKLLINKINKKTNIYTYM